MAKRRNRKTAKVRVIKNPEVIESVVIQESVAIVREPDNFEKAINMLAGYLDIVANYISLLLSKKVA